MSGEAKVRVGVARQDEIKAWLVKIGPRNPLYDPMLMEAADCIGSMQFDSVDAAKALDAERAHADAAEAERDEIAGVVAQLPVWLPRRNEAWREAAASVAMKLDENVAQIVNLMHERDAAEADAAALRGALNNWLAAGCCPGFEIQCGSYSGCDAETTKATDCPSCGPLRAALAPGAGSRVAAVVEAARAYTSSHAANDIVGVFATGSQLRAAVSALDGEGVRDGK